MRSKVEKVLVLVGAVVCGLALSRFAATQEGVDTPWHLPTPKHLDRETRAELDARMGQHGETMSRLVKSVVLLDRPRITLLAGRIADEEVWRAGKKGGRLPLPSGLAAEETKLSLAARALASAAAQSPDDQVLAEKFAVVTSTCVTCHSVYLFGEPRRRSIAPSGR